MKTKRIYRRHNYVDMANKCELADFLTTQECFRQKIKKDKKQKNGDINYTDEAQDIFNKYLEIIEITLNV